MYFGGSFLFFSSYCLLVVFLIRAVLLPYLYTYIARKQPPCCAEHKSVQTHPGVVTELWFGSVVPRADQGCVSCAQPSWSLCCYRMAECLSGHVMMPLEIPGRQSCCTSSMMLSGTWAGPSLPISLQCLEETTKWVLLPWLLSLWAVSRDAEMRLSRLTQGCRRVSFAVIGTFFILINQQGRKTLTFGKLLALHSESLREGGNELDFVGYWQFTYSSHMTVG